MSIRFKRISNAQAGLKIEWLDGQERTLSFLWLRDHARDPASFDQHTHQRLLYTGGIDPNIVPVEWKLINEDDALVICWPDQLEPTEYSAAYLLESLFTPQQSAAEHWGIQCAPPNPQLSLQTVLNQGFSEFLQLLTAHGFVRIVDCPVDESSVQLLAEKIGYVRETAFGGLWAFEANQAMADSAYSSEALRPHTDATYSLDAPGLQLLLCLEPGTNGGESILVDGFAVAAEVFRREPELYNSLCQIPVTGIYKGEGRVLRATRPIFRQSTSGVGIEQITFNNYDRDTLNLSEADTRAFYRGVFEIENYLNDPDVQWRSKLKAGEMIVFDNWRMLHGRGKFTGSRKMAGCYINREDYLSSCEVHA